MPNRTLPESILALFAGRARAAVIYGDLTEMAATHSRLWFAAAYLRTLIALVWRSITAIGVGWLGFQKLAGIYMHLAFATLGHHWSVSQRHMLPWISVLSDPLWFVSLYCAIRFGTRDSFGRLGTIFFLLLLFGVAIFAYAPGLLPTFVCLMLVAIASLLFRTNWRRPLVVFGIMWAVACVGAIGASVGWILLAHTIAAHSGTNFADFLSAEIRRGNKSWWFAARGYLDLAGLSLAAFAGSWLHDRMPRQRPAGAAHA